MRKPTFFICENMVQISFAVTVNMISAFVFATLIVQYVFLIQNFKLLAIFNASTAWFASDLFENHIVGFLMMWLTKHLLLIQSGYSVTTKLFSAFGFATWIVQCLYFLNPKFQSNHLLCSYSSFCVRPGRKPHCWFSY